MNPQRIQLSRKCGWRMPPDTVRVARPGAWGNPFKIGGKFKMGDPGGNCHPAFRMTWCQINYPLYDDPTFTMIETNGQAVEWFKQLMEKSPWDVTALRGKNLACWCKPGEPCHADVLLEMASR